MVIIPGGMNALHLPAFFETIGRANLTSDGPFGISGRQAEEAWTAWRSGQYGSISLSDGVIEFAKTHDEMKRLFLTFRRDADRIYPGWREKLGYKASALGSRLFARALQDPPSRSVRFGAAAFSGCVLLALVLFLCRRM